MGILRVQRKVIVPVLNFAVLDFWKARALIFIDALGSLIRAFSLSSVSLYSFRDYGRYLFSYTTHNVSIFRRWTLFSSQLSFPNSPRGSRLDSQGRLGSAPTAAVERGARHRGIIRKCTTHSVLFCLTQRRTRATRMQNIIQFEFWTRIAVGMLRVNRHSRTCRHRTMIF
jgi:hypothetical protein